MNYVTEPKDGQSIASRYRQQIIERRVRRHEATDLDPFMLKYAMAAKVNAVQAHSEKERVWRGPYR
jgi:hypothetical protein